MCETEGFGIEGCVELRGFWCGTEKFLRAEKEWSFCVELMCWTEGGVELRGTAKNAKRASEVNQSGPSRTKL